MDGGESVRGGRVLGSMMLEGEKSSEANSQRCRFGDKGSAERGDWIGVSGVGVEVARILVWGRWRYDLGIWIGWEMRNEGCRGHDKYLP